MTEKNELQKCFSDLDYLAEKYFFDLKFCMAYDKTSCHGHIIKAHTVSRKYIKNIEKENQVYVPFPSSMHESNLYEFELEDIDKVTRFTGFCKEHDVLLFSSFENSDFNGSYNQIYDITFRALCREYYQKKCMLQFSERVSRGDLNSLDYMQYCKTNDFRLKNQHLEKELKDYKFIYGQLKKVKNRGLNYILIKLTKLPLMTTGVFFPLRTPDRNRIQNERKKQLGFIYNVVTLKDETYILIATVKSLHNNVHADYLKSLASMKRKALLNYLLNYFFFNNDNITIDPNWFDHLDTEFQIKINDLMNLQVGNYGHTCGITNFLEFDRRINLNGSIAITLKIN